VTFEMDGPFTRLGALKYLRIATCYPVPRLEAPQLHSLDCRDITFHVRPYGECCA